VESLFRAPKSQRVNLDAFAHCLVPPTELGSARDACRALRPVRIRLRTIDRVTLVLRIGSIVLRVDDLQRQIEFWEAALDYVQSDVSDDDFMLLRPRDGVGPNLSLDNVPSRVQVPPRIHLDLYTEDQGGEVERLKALGATEVHWDKRPPDADYVILADPEGNRFCVVDTSS